jgi:predicted ATPase
MKSNKTKYIISPRFALTGGPCTGKTTLLGALKNDGHQIVPETPTIIFEEEIKKTNKRPDPSTAIFQLRLMNKQLEFESKLQNNTHAFLDRSIVDIVGYCRFFGITPPKELIEKVKAHRYDGVFLLSFLSFYETTTVRPEPIDVAKKIHTTLKETYEDFGYNLIEIPSVSVEQRVKFIFEKINKVDFRKDDISFDNIHEGQL